MLPGDSRHMLRAIFGEDALLYDRMRPTYPSAVFEALAEFGQLGPASRVLEIGCGTGQATRALAERGYVVTAVELSVDLAAVATNRLAAFPNVDVVVSAFEDWQLPARPFDAIVSATAFHWLDPDVRIARSAAALRGGGTLAIIGTHHIAGGDTPFFEQAQDCYERWDPATPPGLRLQTADEIPVDTTELDDSGLFEPAVVHRYEWSLTYSEAEYRDLLLTYSGHRALEPGRQAQLLDCITALINSSYGGRITKRYMTELTLGRLTDF